MKTFEHITDYQILYLARDELLNRIETEEKNKSRRAINRIKTYTLQLNEIQEELNDIKKSNVE